MIGDQEKTVRQAKRMIDLASSLECPLVRVFGFHRSGGESLAKTTSRICNRLAKVVDHADKTGVRVSIENGGDYITASSLMDILDTIQSPLLRLVFRSGCVAGWRIAGCGCDHARQ